MRINTNVSALNTQRALMRTEINMNKSLEKLSSGLRINRASDDAAGLSISETLRGQIKGLQQAQKNALDGISMINVAEGALNEVTSILQRMRELSVQASNGVLTTTDRTSINNEVQALKAEINNITSFTSFNGFNLLQNASTFTFQVGANNGQTLLVTTSSVNTTGLTLGTTAVTTQAGAASSLLSIDAAIARVSNIRSSLGAVSNRLEYTINNLGISAENMSAAESRIRDTDMAQEMSNLTRSQILMQASTSMLAQANVKPQGVLALFG